MGIVEIRYNPMVEKLLGQCSLPYSDLQQNENIILFGIHEGEELIACVGLEVYEDKALLRSLAVDSEHRKEGIGRKLTEHIENYCQQENITEVYLLTQTAENYFKRIGYTPQERENVPSSIQGTTQYSGLCPSSSTVMRKLL